MNRKKISLKVLSLALSASMFFSVLPAGLYANEPDKVVTEEEPEVISDNTDSVSQNSETSEETDSVSDNALIDKEDKDAEEISDDIDIDKEYEELMQYFDSLLSDVNDAVAGQGFVSDDEGGIISEDPLGLYVDSNYSFNNLPRVKYADNPGNIIMYVDGYFSTDVTNYVVNKINTIRKYACDKGYPNPNDKSKKLTSKDYTAVKWSGDLESIARLRAAEATVVKAGERPNGDATCEEHLFTQNGVKSYSEALAWTEVDKATKQLETGIAIWEKQKDEYLKGNYKYTQSGDYQTLINPNVKYVGMASFKNTKGKQVYSIALETSNKSNLSDSSHSNIGYPKPEKYSVPIEFNVKYVTDIALKNPPKYLKPGQTGKFTAKGSAKVNDHWGSDIEYSSDLFKAEYFSSDTSILEIESDGSFKVKNKEGKVTITLRSDSKEKVYKDIKVISDEHALELTVPNKNVYVVGEKPDYKGGKVKNVVTNSTVSLSTSNVSGFDTKTPGVKELTVKNGGFEKTFKILVIEPAEVKIDYGENFSVIKKNLPKNEYGKYIADNNDSEKPSAVGAFKYTIRFVPNAGSEFKENKKVPLTVNVYRAIDNTNGTLTVIALNKDLVYTGVRLEPDLRLSIEGVALKEGVDYELTYGWDTRDNISPENDAAVVIRGIGFYKGYSVKFYDIQKAKLTVTAKSYRIANSEKEENIPVFKNIVEGLLANHKISYNNEPQALCDDIKEQTSENYDFGDYTITPNEDAFTILDAKGEDVTANYDITFVNGTLKVTGDFATYDVTYEMNGHGDAITDREHTEISAGSLIERPEDPVEEGYVFAGWYKDSSFKTAWDFAVDTVQSDVTLYARWAKVKTNDFRVEAIPDQTYTGNALKPLIGVYDGETLLKSGKDYTVAYFNNVEVNATKADDDVFNSRIPYATIKGKGNYSSEYNINFNIVPALIGEGEELSDGFNLTYNSSLMANNKSLKVFTALKYKKALREGIDFDYMLITVNAFNEKGAPVATGKTCSGGMVPAGYTGTFSLEITGKGFYTGSVNREVFVSDKDHLISKANITIDPAYRTVEYTGENIVLPSNAITVKLGNKVLTYGKNYVVSYDANEKVGNATVTVTGTGAYMGSKNVSFKIKGKTFSAQNVNVTNFPSSLSYTSKALYVNDAKLVYADSKGSKKLVNGIDYTVSYSKNINKGTATVTFKGNESAGFSGSFKKTFKIEQVDLADTLLIDSTDLDNELSVEFSKGGATVTDLIKLINKASNTELVYNKDYTISYSQNKKLGSKNDSKAPQYTVKGKGNYKGSLVRRFNIVEKELSSEDITVEVAQIQFNASKKDDFIYKPAVTLKDKNVTVAKTEYTLEYVNCDQVSVRNYLSKKDGCDYESEVPHVIIKAVAGMGYSNSIGEDESVPVIAQVYEAASKMSSANTYVVVDNVSYIQKQCVPEVRVYFTNDKNTLNIIKKLRDHDAIMNASGGNVEFVSDDKYSVTYGENRLAGKNKGTVTVKGKAPYYGGSVKVKFDINQKAVSFK